MKNSNKTDQNDMNPQTEVSIIIPARNEAEHLDSCLNSIQKAFCNIESHEIIVVDNHSTDETVNIAERYGCRIVENLNIGVSSTRNAGVAASKGELIAFIDADCILHEKWYEFTKEHFNDPQVMIVGTKISPDFSNATWIENCVFHLNNRRSISSSANAMKVNWIGTSNMLIKKSAFDEIGGFNESLISAEDYDLCERLTGIGDILLDKRIYTVHLRESKSLTELFNREMWRGQNSLSHWVKNGFSFYEAPSVIIPVAFLLLVFMGICSLFFHIGVGITCMLLAVCCPLLMVVRSKKVFSDCIFFIQSIVVSTTYLAARGLAVIKELFN